MRLLITGCGRSGTKFASRWLQDKGMDVGHETDGVHGTSSWLLAACETQAVGAKLQVLAPLALPLWHDGTYDWAEPRFIVHLVREPLACIASLCTVRQDTWEWVAQHIDLDPEWPTLKKALHYWVKWNLLAERMADMRVHVESIRHEYEALPNAREHAVVTWATLLSRDTLSMLEQAQAMGRRYGY